MEILEIKLSDHTRKDVEKILKTLDEMGVKYSKKEEETEETLEEYNKALDEADAAIERGEYMTMEQLVKEMKTW